MQTYYPITWEEDPWKLRPASPDTDETESSDPVASSSTAAPMSSKQRADAETPPSSSTPSNTLAEPHRAEAEPAQSTPQTHPREVAEAPSISSIPTASSSKPESSALRTSRGTEAVDTSEAGILQPTERPSTLEKFASMALNPTHKAETQETTARPASQKPNDVENPKLFHESQEWISNSEPLPTLKRSTASPSSPSAEELLQASKTGITEEATPSPEELQVYPTPSLPSLSEVRQSDLTATTSDSNNTAEQWEFAELNRTFSPLAPRSPLPLPTAAEHDTANAHETAALDPSVAHTASLYAQIRTAQDPLLSRKETEQLIDQRLCDLKIYVLESEITEAQHAVKSIVEQASF